MRRTSSYESGAFPLYCSVSQNIMGNPEGVSLIDLSGRIFRIRHLWNGAAILPAVYGQGIIDFFPFSPAGYDTAFLQYPQMV